MFWTQQTLSTVLEYAEDIEVYLNELGLRQRIQVLSHMETDKVVEYLKTLDKTERNNLMDLLDEDTRHDVNLLWSFDEDEIGSVMTTNYIEVTEGISVREAMKELIDQAAGERQHLHHLRHRQGPHLLRRYRPERADHRPGKHAPELAGDYLLPLRVRAGAH